MPDGFIQQMVEAIVQEVKPQCIYLFGSRARGTATEDSDVDLLIVEAETFDPSRSRWSELRRIRRVLKPFHVPKDVLVYSHEEFEKWRGSINHIVAHAISEGRLVYERS
jgi:predicted nucleotidyltransferase